MSINRAEIHQDNKSIRDRKQRQQRNSDYITYTLKFTQIFCAYFLLSVSSQKAYRSGHTKNVCYLETKLFYFTLEKDALYKNTA